MYRITLSTELSKTTFWGTDLVLQRVAAKAVEITPMLFIILVGPEKEDPEKMLRVSSTFRKREAKPLT